MIEIVIENFIEKVARKISFLDELNKKKIAYEVLDSDTKAYIHPNSYLLSSMPDYLVYSEMFFSKKLILNNNF